MKLNEKLSTIVYFIWMVCWVVITTLNVIDKPILWFIFAILFWVFTWFIIQIYRK